MTRKRASSAASRSARTGAAQPSDGTPASGATGAVEGRTSQQQARVPTHPPHQFPPPSGPPNNGFLSRLLVGGGLALYIVLFFSVAHHRDWLAYLLIPDEILHSIFGSPSTPVVFGDRWPVVGVTVMILGISGGVGSLALRLLGLRLARFSSQPMTMDFNLREQLAFASLTGGNLLSSWTLLVGWLVGFQSPMLLIGPPLLAGGVGLIWEFWSWWCFHRGGASSASDEGSCDREDPSRPSRWSRWALWLAPFAIILALGSLLPPWEFDVLEYHLQIPQEWWRRGAIGFVPHNVYGNMPLGAEMHALLAMNVFGGEDGWFWGALAGKTVTGVLALVIAIGIWGTGARWWGERVGAIAAVLFLTTPWVLHVSQAGLIDIVLGGYVFLSLAAYVRARSIMGLENPITSAPNSESGVPAAPLDAWRWLALAGYLAGGAAACKYPGVVFAIVPLCLASLRISSQASRRLTRVAATLVILAGAMAGGGAWYLKNAVTSGNPVYPLLYEAFGGATRTPTLDNQWRAAHRPPGYSPSQLAASAAQVAWSSPWLGPLIIPFVVLAFAERRNRSSLFPWLAFAIWGFGVWWLATHRIDRFWLPLLPVLSLLAGSGWQWARHVLRPQLLDTLTHAMLALMLLVVLAPGSRHEPFGDNRYFMPLDVLREASTPSAYKHLRNNLAEGDRVLLVGEARPFYLGRDAIYFTCFDENAFDRLFQNRTANERRETLASERIAYLYVNWQEIDRYRRPGNYGFSPYINRTQLLRECVEEHPLLRPIPLEGDSGELFEVRR